MEPPRAGRGARMVALGHEGVGGGRSDVVSPTPSTPEYTPSQHITDSDWMERAVQ